MGCVRVVGGWVVIGSRLFFWVFFGIFGYGLEGGLERKKCNKKGLVLGFAEGGLDVAEREREGG